MTDLILHELPKPIDQKIIPTIEQWISDGVIGIKAGMCSNIPPEFEMFLEVFTPIDEDIHELCTNGLSTQFWASGEPLATSWEEAFPKYFGLTDLRLTILAFIAVLNEEV